MRPPSLTGKPCSVSDTISAILATLQPSQNKPTSTAGPAVQTMQDGTCCPQPEIPNWTPGLKHPSTTSALIWPWKTLNLPGSLRQEKTCAFRSSSPTEERRLRHRSMQPLSWFKERSEPWLGGHFSIRWMPTLQNPSSVPLRHLRVHGPWKSPLTRKAWFGKSTRPTTSGTVL